MAMGTGKYRLHRSFGQKGLDVILLSNGKPINTVVFKKRAKALFFGPQENRINFNKVCLRWFLQLS